MVLSAEHMYLRAGLAVAAEFEHLNVLPGKHDNRSFGSLKRLGVVI